MNPHILNSVLCTVYSNTVVKTASAKPKATIGKIETEEIETEET